MSLPPYPPPLPPYPPLPTQTAQPAYNYCSATQFLIAYDYRRVGQLLSDTGTPYTYAQLTSGNSALQYYLDLGAAQLNSAASIGARYSQVDLAQAAAIGASNTVVQLVADLAWIGIVSRRGVAMSSIIAQAPKFKIVEEQIQQLKDGELIFGSEFNNAAPDAGLPALNPSSLIVAGAPFQLGNAVRLFGAIPANNCGQNGFSSGCGCGSTGGF
jgi:hypothetical protein